MLKNILVGLSVLALSGCSVFQIHKPEIEQGNVITASEVERLHTGMTEEQVKAVMGTPMLVNIFTPNRIEYVYTFEQGRNNHIEKRVTCIFGGGVLREIVK